MSIVLQKLRDLPSSFPPPNQPIHQPTNLPFMGRRGGWVWILKSGLGLNTMEGSPKKKDFPNTAYDDTWTSALPRARRSAPALTHDHVPEPGR